jgi:cytochrome c peroxidase
MKKLVTTVIVGLITIILVAATIDLNIPFNYENQSITPYITKDNTGGNEISDMGATLGRVLFYDKNLSLNNTIACASCHLQEFAFGDTALASLGFDGGLTGRHSMRLVNPRFSDEIKFFWDERADSLEMQATMPIKDHIEMGFSGTNGQPDFDSLINKLYTIDYYEPLFYAVFGDTLISEDRIQKALAQFTRSIQSFDSKYDEGRIQVNNDAQDFPNYTNSENNGKTLFLDPPPLGGAGCAGCHRPPEFDIDPNTLNNGIVGVIGSNTAIDITNTRAPSIRDIVNPNGDLNGPLMHNGSVTSLPALIAHYNTVVQVAGNTNLDPRLQGPGGDLQLTPTESQDLINFLETLTSSAIYTDEKWSDPFDENGDIEIIPLITAALSDQNEFELVLYPNPMSSSFEVKSSAIIQSMQIFNVAGKLVYLNESLHNKEITVNTTDWKEGMYIVRLISAHGEMYTHKIMKQ